MSEILSYVRFNDKLSLLQRITDTDTGEILMELKSSVLTLNIKYFGIILLRYISLLREGRKNLQLQIRTYCNVRGTNELGFIDENSDCPF